MRASSVCARVLVVLALVPWFKVGVHAQVLPPHSPEGRRRTSVHCWNAETNSNVACGSDFEFTLANAPRAELRTADSVSFATLFNVTDQFVNKHGGEVSGLRLGALRAKICRGVALLCHPRRSDGGLSHDSGAPGTVTRDGMAFTVSYAITMVS
jgi:hypothetical protein